MPQPACDTQELTATDRYFPTAKIIEYLNNNLNYSEIAKIAGISKQAVRQRAKPYAATVANIEAVKSQRANLLAIVTNSMLEVYLSLSDEEKKKHVQRRGLVDYGILYDKMRLETGQSTSNIAYTDMIKARDQLMAEMRAIPGGEIVVS